MNPPQEAVCRHFINSDKALSVEIDEQWSYVQNKKEQRWLWYALEHSSKRILAYVFGKREDSCLAKLLEKLSCFSIKTFFTDNWGSYRRLIPEEKHIVGKQFTQCIERCNLNLRTHIKRLTRRTICFSKSSQMHDRIIGEYIQKNYFNKSDT